MSRLTVRASCLLLCAVFALTGCATIRADANRDRVVVITGASSGFGRGVALRLAEGGARLVLAARRTELLEELARECRQRGGQAIAVTTDVARAGDVERLARAAADAFGRIDVWINDAGIGAVGRFDEIPVDDHRRVVAVNLAGVILGSHAALRQFRVQGQGRLVNIASMTGRVPLPYYATYSATKAAVVGLGAALTEELRLAGERDIHVSTLLPYAADTPWWGHAANYSGHEPTMVLMDPPAKVVDAIVRATIHPKPMIAVGYKAKAFVVLQRLAPGLTLRAAGRVTHDALVGSGPAATTTGSLYEPTPSGTTVSGP
jgi:short-subunit dehydrogenase